MPSFVWKGRTRAGQLQEGQLLADTQAAAIAVLRRQQIQVTAIREKGREIKLLPRIPRGIGQKRVAIFTRQFSVMIDAGLPLVQCLEILGDQEENRTFQTRHPGRAAPTSSPARRSPTRCGSTPRPSTTSTSTWSRPARRAVSSTSSCSACRPTSRRRSS